MPLVTTAEMFKKAYAGRYAVGAFNINNMEIVQAVTEAAGELNSPGIGRCEKICQADIFKTSGGSRPGRISAPSRGPSLRSRCRF